MDWYEILEVNLGKNKYLCFKLFEILFLIFYLKNETMKNIHNPFSSSVTFLYPPKTSENLWFCDVFGRYRNVILD